MTDVLTVDRTQVIAYRVAQQGLQREASAAGDLAVFDIGVQDGQIAFAGFQGVHRRVPVVA